MIQILRTRVILFCLPDLPDRSPVDHCDLFSARNWLCPPKSIGLLLSRRYTRFASVDKASAKGRAILTYKVQDVMDDLLNQRRRFASLATGK
jgi:hypothetical protein